MNPSELRLGNWVTIKNEANWTTLENKPMIVVGLHYAGEGAIKLFPKSSHSISVFNHATKREYSQFNEFIQPIILTEEWLYKFGFEENGVDKKENEKYRKYWSEGKFDVYKIISFYLDNNKSHEPDIKYVHQLQNLYFALTGEELTLKTTTNE